MTSLCITLLPKSSLPRFPTTSLLYAGFFSDLVLLSLNRMNQYQLILKLTIVKNCLYGKKPPYSLAIKVVYKIRPIFNKEKRRFLPVDWRSHFNMRTFSFRQSQSNFICFAAAFFFSLQFMYDIIPYESLSSTSESNQNMVLSNIDIKLFIFDHV